MNVATTPSGFLDPILTTLRENRLVLERLVQWKGVEPGMIHSVADCGVYSLALGLTPHGTLERQLDLLNAGTGPVSLEDEGGAIRIDAGGRHAWLVAEAVLDVAVEALRHRGLREVSVRNVTEPAQLGVISAIAEKHDLSAKVEPQDDGAVSVTITARHAAEPKVLDRIRTDGIAAKRSEWFHLFRLSSNALAEDTPISRTHTGSFMVKPDGTIVGHREDEYAYEDVSMLTAERLEYRR